MYWGMWSVFTVVMIALIGCTALIIGLTHFVFFLCSGESLLP